MMPATQSAVFSTDEARRKLLARLARVEGQLRGVQKMIESGSGCDEVAQQLAAARGALGKALYELIACAVESTLSTGGELDSEMKKKLSDVTALLAKYA